MGTRGHVRACSALTFTGVADGLPKGLMDEKSLPEDIQGIQRCAAEEATFSFCCLHPGRLRWPAAKLPYTGDGQPACVTLTLRRQFTSRDDPSILRPPPPPPPLTLTLYAVNVAAIKFHLNILRPLRRRNSCPSGDFLLQGGQWGNDHLLEVAGRNKREPV